MKLKTYKIERVEVESVDLTIPEETVYLFQTGVRRMIRIIPLRFGKEDVYELKVTCIYLSGKCKIEDFRIELHMIEKYWNSKDSTVEKEIIGILLSGDCYERTEADFNKDFNQALNIIN